MKLISNQALFIFFSVLVVLLLYLLSPILTPFIMGALLAYLANPLVLRLDKYSPHILNVLLIFLALFGFLIAIILIIAPLFQEQITTFIESIPNIVLWIEQSLIPKLKEIIDVETIKTSLYNILPKSGILLTTFVKSSYAVIIWTINLVLIPIVTFYLLRDWGIILTNTKSIIPKSVKPTVLKLAHECDEVLSAFFRGQFLVMIALSIIYGVGLSLIGINVGLFIGIVGGLLSIVPFLGSIFVVIVGSLTALAQFGTWEPALYVLGVYIVGQAIEGYVLTPYLIGQRIGLHPVAVIFSIMAGGTLFGFFGILIALPAAAIILVLLRFLNQRLQSA